MTHMKPEWKSFLENAGAEFSNDRVISFGNPDQEHRVAHSGDVICDLSHYGLIAAYGDDVVSFLQGQFTNDLAQVDLEHSQLGAYCNPKGRMISNFRIIRRQQTYYIVLPYELLETTFNRLRMFVLRAKVTLEDASEALAHIGLSGEKSEQQLCDIVGIMPEHTDGVVQHENLSIVRVAGTTPRFEIYGLLEDITKLWQALDVHAAPVGADVWELLNIRAGLPVIVSETSEAFVPQMANMELINGVSFKKGCYTGQEIVARMHYLGKLKRRMYHIHINTDETPMPGDKLRTEDSKATQDIGSLVSAQQNPDGGYEALAVIQIKDAEGSALKLHDANGPAVKVLELPYSLEVKE